MDLTTIEQLSAIGTAVGTVALVFMFWKTIKQLEETITPHLFDKKFPFLMNDSSQNINHLIDLRLSKIK